MDIEDIPFESFEYEPISSIEIISETETDSSNYDSLNRKKRNSHTTNTTTNVTTKSRNNQSHTYYFFHNDPIDTTITYCKVCETNLAGTRQKPYAYSRKGGNTTNLIVHLRDKHKITKENYLKFLDDSNEVGN
jgi:hypothetical protein